MFPPQPRELIWGVGCRAKQQPLFIHDLLQTLEVQVVDQCAQLLGRPSTLLSLAQQHLCSSRHLAQQQLVLLSQGWRC
jgi:hypothetical protein